MFLYVLLDVLKCYDKLYPEIFISFLLAFSLSFKSYA